MPAGRPSDYNPAFCEDVIALAAEGMSQAEIAFEFGIARSTLHEWGEKHPEFSAALSRAKTAEQMWWEKKARNSLEADRFQQVVWAKSMQDEMTYLQRQIQQYQENAVTGRTLMPAA